MSQTGSAAIRYIKRRFEFTFVASWNGFTGGSKTLTSELEYNVSNIWLLGGFQQHFGCHLTMFLFFFFPLANAWTSSTQTHTNTNRVDYLSFNLSVYVVCVVPNPLWVFYSPAGASNIPTSFSVWASAARASPSSWWWSSVNWWVNTIQLNRGQQWNTEHTGTYAH